MHEEQTATATAAVRPAGPVRRVTSAIGRRRVPVPLIALSHHVSIAVAVRTISLSEASVFSAQASSATRLPRLCLPLAAYT